MIFLINIFVCLQSGKLLEPVITKLDENKLILVKDDMSIFIDSQGTPTETQVFKWSDFPTVIGIIPSHVLP